MLFCYSSSTVEKRAECVKNKDLLRDFSFTDMADLYKLSTVLSVELLRPSIELFYEAEQMLRNYMIEMIKNIDFKYNKNIENVLIEFIKKSKEMDVSGVIINNQQILLEIKKVPKRFLRVLKKKKNTNG